MSNVHFVPYPQGEEGGIIAVSILSSLSFLALVSVAFRVLLLGTRFRPSTVQARPEYIFFNTQLGHYAACLLLGNLFMEIPGLIGIRWLSQGGITEGGLCTAQAILSQTGNWATAYFVVTIAVHTFNSLVLRKRQSNMLCTALTIGGWVLAGVLAAAPLFNAQRLRSGPPYGADGPSCGLRPVYPRYQFFFHLLPIFIAFVLSAVLYSITFLVLRGTLNIKRGIKLTLDPHERWADGKINENYHPFVARIASSMIWYPVGYILLLVPYSVTRLLQISGWQVPFGLVVFAYTCWSVLGVVNVLFLYNTFRVLGPVFDDHTSSRMWQSENESFGTSEPLGQPTKLRQSYKEKGDTSSPLAVSSPSSHAFELSSPRPDHAQVPVRPERAVSMQSSYTHSERTTSIRSSYSYPERATSTQSFYSFSASPPIGRAIMPALDLNQPLVSESVDYPTIPHAFNVHDHQGSTYSLGLPAAPRRTRSPILRLPSIGRQGSPASTVTAVRSPIHHHRNLSKQTSYDTLLSGASSPRSALSPQPSLSNWGPRSYKPSPDGLVADEEYAQARPMLSAVNPKFPLPVSLPQQPAPRHTRSLSAIPKVLQPAVVGRQRTLISKDIGFVRKVPDVSYAGIRGT